jgi:RES domain-containing protein
MDESRAVRVASVPVTTVEGTWLRHAFAAYPERALDGRVYDGRWGTKPGFPVLYLGNPLESIIVEAYRHLVDPVENPDVLEHIHPRILVTADVAVTDVLDLRTAGARAAAGLTLSDLQSGVDEYADCQEVAQVAHQLGRHGVLAPAATKMGETLALFTDLTEAAGQNPIRSADDVLWETLPPDPRITSARTRLSVVRNND